MLHLPSILPTSLFPTLPFMAPNTRIFLSPPKVWRHSPKSSQYLLISHLPSFPLSFTHPQLLYYPYLPCHPHTPWATPPVPPLPPTLVVKPITCIHLPLPTTTLAHIIPSAASPCLHSHTPHPSKCVSHLTHQSFLSKNSLLDINIMNTYDFTHYMERTTQIKVFALVSPWHHTECIHNSWDNYRFNTLFPYQYHIHIFKTL